MAEQETHRSDPLDPETLSLWTEDGLSALDSDASRTYLSETDFTLESPLKVRSIVFDVNAHCRKPVGLDPAFLDTFCERFVDRPIMDRRHEAGLDRIIHGPAPVVGKVDGCGHENGQIWQDQSFWGEAAVLEIRQGVRQSFSISWMDDADTALSCSLCDEMFSEGAPACDHEVGRDGCKAMFSSAEPAEVTRLYTPAAMNTGIQAVHLTADQLTALAPLVPVLVELFERHGVTDLGGAVDVSGVVSGSDVLTDLGPMDGAAERIAQLEQQLSAVTGELHYKEAERVILRAREQGKLGNGDPERQIAMYLEMGPSLGNEWLRQIPANPGLAATGMLSGMGSHDVMVPEGHNGRDWQTALTIAATSLSHKESISYEAAHARLFSQYRPTPAHKARGAQPRRQGE